MTGKEAAPGQLNVHLATPVWAGSVQARQPELATEATLHLAAAAAVFLVIQTTLNRLATVVALMRASKNLDAGIETTPATVVGQDAAALDRQAVLDPACIATAGNVLPFLVVHRSALTILRPTVVLGQAAQKVLRVTAVTPVLLAIQTLGAHARLCLSLLATATAVSAGKTASTAIPTPALVNFR